MIYPQRLGQAHIKMLKALNHDPDNEAAGVRLIGTFIENGLRAQARTGNFLTGQLYIALDFYPKADKVTFDANARPVMIPTLPGSLEQLQEKLESMVDKINKLPIERIAGNLDGNLVELRKGMMQFNGKILPGVQSTLSDVSKTRKPPIRPCNRPVRPWPRIRRNGKNWGRPWMNWDARRDPCVIFPDYLGRHPESLLRGRPNNAAPMDLQGPPRN